MCGSNCGRGYAIPRVHRWPVPVAVVYVCVLLVALGLPTDVDSVFSSWLSTSVTHPSFPIGSQKNPKGTEVCGQGGCPAARICGPAVWVEGRCSREWRCYEWGASCIWYMIGCSYWCCANC